MKFHIILPVIALFISIVLFPVIRKFAYRNGWLDKPNHRKVHNGNIPRLGGIAIAISFFVAFFCGTLLFPEVITIPNYWPIILGMVLIFVIGLVDDFINLPAMLKLVLQLFAASVVVFSGNAITVISVPFTDYSITLPVITYLITFIWIIGITNAMNLIDGLDGQAGLIAAFALSFLGLHALQTGNVLVSRTSFILIGSIAGFLLFNKPPAKIFMGDSGALLLGFTIAVLPLSPVEETISMKELIFPITLLIIPIVDTISAIIRRISRKQKIHSADKLHIHHLLLALGLSNWKILGAIFLYSLFVSTVSFFSMKLPHIYFLTISVFIWIISFGLYFIINKYIKQKLSQRLTDQA